MFSRKIEDRINAKKADLTVTQKKILASIREGELNSKEGYWEGIVEEFKIKLLKTGYKSTEELFEHVLFDIYEVIVGYENALQIQKYAFLESKMNGDLLEKNIHNLSALTFGIEQNMRVDLVELLNFMLSNEQYYLSEYRQYCINWLEQKSGENSMTDQFFVLKLKYELANNNDLYMAILKESIYNDGMKLVGKEIVLQSMIQSGNSQLIEALGNYLIVGQGQEGLREKIVEYVGMGNSETILYFMNIVQEHNLMRYKFMKIAMQNWLEIEGEEKQVFNDVMALSKNQLQIDEYVRSDNPLKVYAALKTAIWTNKSLAYEQFSRGTSAQQLALSYFLFKKKNLTDEEYTYLFDICLTSDHLDTLSFALLKLVENDIYDYHLFDSDGELNNEFWQYIKYDTALFERIEEILIRLNKEYIVSISSFGEHKLTVEALYKLQIIMAIVKKERNCLEGLMAQKSKLAASNRYDLMRAIVSNNLTSAGRLYCIELIGDRAELNRNQAMEYVEQWELDRKEIITVQNLFCSKNKEVRHHAIELLIQLSNEDLTIVIEELLLNKKHLFQQGGKELLEVAIQKKLLTKQQIEHVEKNILTKNIKEEKFDEYTKENGFGLFTPNYQLPSTIKKQKLLSGNLERFLSIDVQKLEDALKHLVALINKNQKEEVEYSIEKKVIKTTFYDFEWELDNVELEAINFIDLPLYSIWRQWADEKSLTYEEYSVIEMCLSLYSLTGYSKCEKTVTNELVPAMNDRFEFEKLNKIIRLIANMESQNILTMIICHLKKQLVTPDDGGRFNLYFNMYDELLHSFTKEQWVSLASRQNETPNRRLFMHPLIEYIFIRCQYYAESDEQFNRLMTLHFEREQRIKGKQVIKFMNLEDLCRAINLGHLPQEALYEQLLTDDSEVLITLFDCTIRTKLYEKYEWLKDVYEQIITRLIDIELSRDELKSPVSKLLINTLDHFQNTELFAKVVKAIDKGKLINKNSHIENSYEKMTVFSHLLEISRPEDELTKQQFNQIITKYNFTDEQLLNAMFYSNAWVPYVCEFIGWDGLESMTWMWIASSNSELDAYEYDNISHYTLLTQQQLKDGFFDKRWFLESYPQLAGQKFARIQKSAKFGLIHTFYTRTKLFMNTAIDTTEYSKLTDEIMLKRNKNKVRSMGLIPLNPDKRLEEATAIFEFLQFFLQQGKKFGAQRRKSEQEAVEVALYNLANNYGGDPTSFIWKMEAASFAKLKPYFKAKSIGDINVELFIDGEGLPEIQLTKSGKRLATIPKSLKEHVHIIELQKIKKQLIEQSVRATRVFEQAMEMATPILYNELQFLLDQPIIAPILKRMVFIAEGHIGLINKKGIEAMNGFVSPIESATPIRIIHAYDLRQHGVWQNWQNYIYSHKIKQPFKQVFRELYLNSNVDNESAEKELIIQRLIQPQKAKVLLERRGWLPDVESGMKKHFATDKIIAKIETEYSWNMIQAGAIFEIDTIYFTKMGTDEPIHLKNVPSIIYSETLRDFDYVMRVAFVGNIDIDKGLSTLEMREMIVKNYLKMMQIETVEINMPYIHIVNKENNYKIHIGSGTIYSIEGTVQTPPLATKKEQPFLPFKNDDEQLTNILTTIFTLCE